MCIITLPLKKGLCHTKVGSLTHVFIYLFGSCRHHDHLLRSAVISLPDFFCSKEFLSRDSLQPCPAYRVVCPKRQKETHPHLFIPSSLSRSVRLRVLRCSFSLAGKNRNQLPDSSLHGLFQSRLRPFLSSSINDFRENEEKKKKTACISL